MDKKAPRRSLVPYECKRPGCLNGGVGYSGRKACTPTCRSWLWRQEQKKLGRVRTRTGYREPPQGVVRGVKINKNAA